MQMLRKLSAKPGKCMLDMSWGAGGMSGEHEAKRSWYTQRGQSTLMVGEMNRMVAGQSAKNNTKPPTSNKQTDKQTKNKSPNQQSSGKIRCRPMSNLGCELKQEKCITFCPHTKVKNPPIAIF